MDKEDEGTQVAATAKDEQIALLKAVLVQLNEELQKKDKRISELELELLQAHDNWDSVTTTTNQYVCPNCSRGQNSPPMPSVSTSMATRSHSNSSDHFPQNLSPIEEAPCQIGRNTGRSGNHSNGTTPKRESALDQEQRELQQAIATLDSAIAELELQATSKHRLSALRRERAKMMTELNRKVQARLRKVRRNSDDTFTRLATEYENCTREQMCGAVRELDRAQAHYKVYIDQLLAVVLETNPALLEGMPRVQQSTGLRMDLLRMASRGELFDDLKERERNVASLESYASLLAERIMDHAPPLLPALDPFHETATSGMEPSHHYQ